MRLSIVAVLGVGVAWGCIKEYDLERSPPERGTLGEELHAQWTKDTRRGAVDPEQRTELLEQREEEFVSGVDRAVPPDKIGELYQVLRSFLPLVEQGYFPAATRRVPGALDDAVADDDLMDALENPPPYRSSDYVDPYIRGGIFAELANYDRLAEFGEYSGGLLLDHDGLDEDGEPVVGDPTSYPDLLVALSELSEREPTPHPEDRWGSLLRDMLMHTDNRYREGEPARGNRVALFDDRGVPRVRTDVDGDPRAPFVDEDGDGLADLDEAGRFVLDGGQALEIPPHSTESIDHPELQRGGFGRVENTDNRAVFEYVDIADTTLSYLLSIFGRLTERDVVAELAQLTEEVFGPTVPGEDDRGTYRGFPDDHPLVDLFDAVMSSLGIDGLADAAGVLARYIERNSGDVATVVETFREAGQQIADDPNVDLAEDQTLFYDQLDVLREITANPELFADLMEALRDPVVERTGDAMATLIEYRDTDVVPPPEGPYNQCFYDCKANHEIGTVDRFECIRDCPNDVMFSQPIDFEAPESPENRSQYQRLYHLLRDTAGVEYELSVEEIQEPWLGLEADDLPVMFRLPGAAEAFIRAIAGELHLSDYISEEFDDSIFGTVVELLENLTGGSVDDDNVANVFSIFSAQFGVQLDPVPGPDQVTRLFNQTDLRVDYETSDGDVLIDVTDPVCRDEFVMANHHAEGLFTAEASGLIDVIHPIAVAFAQNDREDLLAQLFVQVHRHYSGHDDMYLDADGYPSPMEGSNLRSTEPVLKEIFEDGEIFSALRRLALSTENMTDDTGVALDERVRQLLHRAVRNDDGYAPRTGPGEIELPDGSVLEDVSRLEVALDRLPQLSDRIEDEETRERFVDAAEQIADTALRIEEVDEGEYDLRPEASIALLSDMFRFLGVRAEKLERRGDFDQWFNDEAPQTMQSVFSSRGFYALIELLRAFHSDEQGRELVEDLSLYLTENPERSDDAAVAAYGLMVRLLNPERRMPITRFVAGIFDPDREVTVEPHGDIPNGRLLAMFLTMIPDYDTEGYALDMVARGSSIGPDHGSTWGMLADLLVRYFSSDPTGNETLTREERADALERIGHWFHDDVQGAERFYEIVEMRGEMQLEEMEE